MSDDFHSKHKPRAYSARSVNLSSSRLSPLRAYVVCRAMRLGTATLLIFSVGLGSACGGDEGTPPLPPKDVDLGFSVPDVGTTSDSGGQPVDSGEQMDATMPPEDAGFADSGVDTGFDGGVDDGGFDVGFDTGVDTGVEPVVDVGVDGGVVIVFDSGFDSGFPDLGFPDTGIPDLGFPDLGFPDTGIPDSGSIDAGSTPVNPALEGVTCTSSFMAPSTTFLRDNCAAGHLCVPWDTVYPNASLTGPVESCVRPCSVDADCGQNTNGTPRHCVESGFVAATGAARICVDTLAPPDRFCGFSRRTVSLQPQVAMQTGTQMVGCSGGTTCQVGFFGDVHVDEGVCLAFCSTSANCPASLPYCNPDVFPGVGQSVGVCSDVQRSAGSLCGSSNPADLGITSRCDTSPTAGANLTCLPGTAGVIGVDLPTGLGICASICNGTNPCNGRDPVLGATTCSSLYLTGVAGQQFGICSAGCTAFPENCGGTGSRNAGRFCGGPGVLGSEICIDVQPPTLVPGSIVNGVASMTVGDNCLAGTSPLSCPVGAQCYVTNGSAPRGACFYGCSRARGATNVCNGFLGTTTATCADVFPSSSAIGLCGR